MIGSRIGNFLVAARLGEGGMGTVYRGTDVMLDRGVALKVLRADLAGQRELLERFRAEAVALARLQHPNITALYGLEQAGDQLVMVMEYIDGDTMEHRLRHTGALPWDRAIVVVRGVLAALGHAHARGVVHRDIKPANVMADRTGTVKVMDFGIARLMGQDRQTRAGAAVGTPSYMAPEQLRGQDVDGRTDLYAVGALLFELVTGRVAFDGDSDYALMMQQLNEPPPQASALMPGVPPALDEVIGRAMAKKPAQRFATADEFATALDAVLAGAPMRRTPIPRALAGLADRAPRDWRVYVTGGAALLTAVFLTIGLRARPPEPTPPPATRDSAATPLAGIAAADLTAGASGGRRGTVSTPAPRTDDAGPPSGGAWPAPTTATPSRKRSDSTRVVQPRASARVSPTPGAPPARSGVTPATPRAGAPAPSRDADPSVERDDVGARQVRVLADRCAQVLRTNNGAAAADLLRGGGGLVTAASDGRIQEVDVGAVDTDVAGGRATGRVSLTIRWRTPFGGNRTGVARLVAEARQSDGRWQSAGCSVSATGGVQ